MDVTLSRSTPLYAGTDLTLECTVRLDSTVNSGEDVMTEWRGLQGIPEEQYSVTGVSNHGSSYTHSLTISPLADHDDDTFITCAVTVTGGSNVQQGFATGGITLTVSGKSMYFTLWFSD